MGYYDIDTSVRINGGLTVNGDTSIPSSYNLYVGGNITGNSNIYIAGSITGNTFSANTINEGGVSLSSKYLGISGTAVSANNAGKLNSLTSDQFLRSDANTTLNATLTATQSIILNNNVSLEGKNTSGSPISLAWINNGNQIGFGNTSAPIYINSSQSPIYWNGSTNYTIWHQGNMGSGSGLDADTVSTYHVGQNLRTTDNVSFSGISAYNGLNTNFGFAVATSGSGNTGLNLLRIGSRHTGLKWDGATFSIVDGSSSTTNADLWTGSSYLSINTSNSTTNITTTTLQHNGHTVWDSNNDGSGSGLDADTIDTIQASQFARNDLANQSVNTGFTMSGNAYVGMSNSQGALYVRTGSGALGIQLAGDNGAKQSGVGAYIASNGTATFTGTMTANAIAVTSTSLVTNLNAQMLNGVKEPQITKNQSIVELGGKGVLTGLSASAQATPNMTIQIASGTVYTDSGMRVVISSQSVAFSSPSATYNRIDSVYVQGSSAGANEGVITVATGTASATPVAPSIPSDGVLLANVTIRQNAGSILSSDITDARVWKPLSTSGINTYVNDLYVGYLASNSGYVTVGKPIKNTTSNNSVTISQGSTSYTWTHNLNLSNYVVRLSCNSPEPHIYWSNKTSNAITVNFDDICQSDVIIDISIEGF